MHLRTLRCRSASAAQVPERTLRGGSHSALIPKRLIPRFSRGARLGLELAAAHVAFSCMPLILIAVLALSGCGDDEPAMMDSDADVGFVPCGGEQCTSDEYCQRPVGFCGTAGNCETRPSECVDELRPVCGCDGKSYSSPCVAAKLNRSVEKNGLCNEDDTPIEG